MYNSLDKLLIQFLQMIDELLISRKYIKDILFGDAEKLANEKDYEEMKSKFHLMGKDFIKQGLIHNYEIIEVTSDLQSGGMKLKDNNNNILISLDVRMSHLYFGVHTDTLKITIAGSYCIKYLLTNKLLSTVSKGSKDIRDLYDVYLLTKYLGIDSDMISNYIEQNGYGQYLFDKLPLTDEDLINYLYTWKQNDTLKTFDFHKSLEQLYYLIGSRNQDKEIKTPVVICGNCSLARNALTYTPGVHLDLFTKYKELDKLNLAIITYYYNPNIVDRLQ